MIRQTLLRLTASVAVVIVTLTVIGLALAQSPLTRAALSSGTYTYPGLAPCDTTLQACIDGLNDGDVIHILPGIYTASLTLDKAVSLIGSEPLLTTILQAPPGQRVLNISGATINSSSVISGLQIIGGDVTADTHCPNGCGGGILISDGAWPTLSNLIVSGNQATIGAGIYIDQTGQAQGAIVIAGSQIVNNIAVDSGGGLYLSAGNVTLARGASIDANTATNFGGGVYVDKGNFILQNGNIRGNQAVPADGGGLYMNNPSATYKQITGTISNNTAAGSGGGLYVVHNNVQLSGGLIFSNTALAGNGGGICVDNGALIWSGPVAVVGNHAVDGGGVYVSTGTTQIFGGQLTGNVASGNGGGLYAGKTLVISETKFLANSAGNTGGGTYFTGNSMADVANSLFARNQAGQAAAGLLLNSSNNVTLRHLTVADPTSNPSEAIVITGGIVDIEDTIITSHSVGISQTAVMLTADYNLYFGNVVNQVGTPVPGSHDVVGLDPLFVDPTPGVDNYHLRLFSPAVDMGTDAGVYTDLGGWPRPIGQGFDIGAFELQADVVPVSPTVGGTLNYTSATGTATEVILPPGLVSTSTVMVFNNLIDTNVGLTLTLPPTYSLSGNVFDLDVFRDNTQVNGVTFTLPVTIVIHYTEADVRGLLRSSLQLYRYEYPPYGDGWCAIGECRPAEGQWLDMNSNTLTVRVLGFSKFGRFGLTAGYEVFLPLIVSNR